MIDARLLVLVIFRRTIALAADCCGRWREFMPFTNVRKKGTERRSIRLLKILQLVSYVERFRHFSVLYAFRGVPEASNFSHTHKDHQVCNA